VALERNFGACQTIVHYFVEVSENLLPTSRDNINAVAEIATLACRNLETWLVSEARRNSPATSHWRRDEIGPWLVSEDRR
jgi:predicted acetyltransferase